MWQEGISRWSHFVIADAVDFAESGGCCLQLDCCASSCRAEISGKVSASIRCIDSHRGAARDDACAGLAAPGGISRHATTCHIRERFADDGADVMFSRAMADMGSAFACARTVSRDECFSSRNTTCRTRPARHTRLASVPHPARSMLCGPPHWRQSSRGHCCCAAA